MVVKLKAKNGSFRKALKCIFSVSPGMIQACAPINAMSTEMFVPLVLFPCPGMMKKAVGMGMKPMKRVGNGSGTISTRSR